MTTAMKSKTSSPPTCNPYAIFAAKPPELALSGAARMPQYFGPVRTNPVNAARG